MKSFRYFAFVLITAVVLSSCTVFEVKDSGPSTPVDVSNIPDAVPKVEPRSPYGNPPSYEQDGVTYRVLKSAKDFKQSGIASWYGTKFHGRRTSSGETYDMYAMTAAHKTLPIPTYVRVTNKANGKQIVVRVNDRGPFKEGRIIDLSYAAAVKLGFHLYGTTDVDIETVFVDGTHEIVGPTEAPSGKQIFVQVGAFSDQQKAKRLADAIRQGVPWPVALSPVRVNAKRLHRVRVGPIESTEDANRLVQTLSMPELGKPKVVFE